MADLIDPFMLDCLARIKAGETANSPALVRCLRASLVAVPAALPNDYCLTAAGEAALANSR